MGPNIASMDGDAGDADATKMTSNEIMQIFEDETELTVRVLPDRSVADWCVRKQIAVILPPNSLLCLSPACLAWQTVGF